jgi:hypothetical protein
VQFERKSQTAMVQGIVYKEEYAPYPVCDLFEKVISKNRLRFSL